MVRQQTYTCARLHMYPVLVFLAAIGSLLFFFDKSSALSSSLSTSTYNSLLHDYYYGTGSISDRVEKLQQIRQIINTVTEQLPKTIYPKVNRNQLRLLLWETILTESTGDIKTKSIRRKKKVSGKTPIGPYQITLETHDGVLERLNSKYPEYAKFISLYYDKSKSVEYNLKHNIRYSTAIALSVYLYRAASDLSKSKSVVCRAKIWSKYYNTNNNKQYEQTYIRKSKMSLEELS